MAGVWLALAGSACGEATGVPIVAREAEPEPEPQPQPPQPPATPEPDLITDPPPPPDDGQLATGPVLGLCDVCQAGSDCGDGNDYCIRYRDQTLKHCGRDCSEGRGCPLGYMCVGLADSSATQCIPEDRSCEHRSLAPVPPRLAELRVTALQLVNEARRSVNAPPLAADECLNEIAQTSSRELALNGQRGIKFARECESELPNCACGWVAEYQVSVSEYELDWTRALELAVDQAMLATTTSAAGPALMNANYGRVGLGVLLGGDEAWISFALGE